MSESNWDKLVYQSLSKDDNIAIAKKILSACNPVRIFALFGQLGAGKTALTQAFCHVLGVRDLVQSPTFSLVHTYLGDTGEIYHFDLYRLKKEEEAYDIGIEEYLDSGQYVFIEWPERIPNLLPPEVVAIHLSITGAQSRTISLKNL